MRIIMMRGKKKLVTMMKMMVLEEVAVVLRGAFVVYEGEQGGEVTVEFNECECVLNG